MPTSISVLSIDLHTKSMFGKKKKKKKKLTVAVKLKVTVASETLSGKTRVDLLPRNFWNCLWEGLSNFLQW